MPELYSPAGRRCQETLGTAKKRIFGRKTLPHQPKDRRLQTVSPIVTGNRGAASRKAGAATAAGAAAGAPGFAVLIREANEGRLCLGIRFRRTQPRTYIAGECPRFCPGIHFRRTRPWIKVTGECRRLPRFQPPPFRVYLVAFVGGRKFSITHSSLLDPSSTLNAKRLLSG